MVVYVCPWLVFIALLRVGCRVLFRDLCGVRAGCCLARHVARVRVCLAFVICCALVRVYVWL